MAFNGNRVRENVSRKDLMVRSLAGPTWYYTGERDALGYSQTNPIHKGRYISGGAFSVEHVSSTCDVSEPMDYGFYGKWRYAPLNGLTYLSFVDREVTRHLSSMPKLNLLPSSLDGLGATGWKRTRPGNSAANAAVLLGEMRRLPTLPLQQLQKLKNFRSLGSEYLNVEFGWKPFVSDVRKMFETYQSIDRRLAQLVRDNGRGVRRNANLGTTETTTTDITPSGFLLTPTYPSFGGTGHSMSRTRVKTVTTRTWYVARYRYYIPDVGTSQWTRRATRALYGANVTPDVLYELLPWSWLVDYFSNVGDVISNMSPNAVDKLTADYAYVMRSTEERLTWTVSGSVWTPTNRLSFNLTGNNSVSSKLRQVATPFGFGIKWDGLSASQLGILTALGISRSRF